MFFLNWHRISRSRAFFTHLIISALIASATLGIMLALWYPPPLFTAMGGGELILLIVSVDVVIGPLLTLVVFNPRKGAQLLIDLTIIALLQASALAYGVYAMHAGRPVYVAFNENRFIIVAASEVDESSLARTPGEFAQLPQTGPRKVAVRLPADRRLREDLLFAQFGRYGPQNSPEYLVPYAQAQSQALQASYTLDQMHALTPDDRDTLDSALKDLHRHANDLRFLAVLAKTQRLTALLDARDGSFLALLPIDPKQQ
jgi:hypothetical protein